MARPLTVTAFATDTSLKKRRFRKAILCSLDWLELAGVAFQAADFDGTGKVNVVVLLKTWRDVPFARLGVVGDRCLKQVASQHGDVTAACRTRTNEVVQAALAAQIITRAPFTFPQVLEKRLSLLFGNSVGHA